jgi:amino acid transporter
VHEKKMSLFSATLLNVNLMIGAGILIGPQVMAQKAGAASFLGWPIVALIFLPIMVSIAHMALTIPGTGNVYGFARAGLGESAGFISSWSYFIGFNGS